MGLKSFVTVVVLILSVVLGQQQIQVEARICCPSNDARNMYYFCRKGPRPPSFCAQVSGCKIVDGKCDKPYSNSDDANAIEFCKLGCASSACDNIKALGNKEASDALDRCNEACYHFCKKHVRTTEAATTVVS